MENEFVFDISVCICTYNRDEYLRASLDSIANQDYDFSRYELILVDNNSTDSTHEIVKDFEKKNPNVNFKYFLEKNQGLSYARNRGIKESRSAIITFIDDDAITTPNYLQHLVNIFRNPEVKAAGGKVLPYYPDGDPPKWLSKYMLGLISCLDNGDEIKEFKRYPLGCNMAFRSSVIDEVGDFNVNLGRKKKDMGGSEEKDIFNRIKAMGYKIMYVPEALVYHTIPAFRITDDYIGKLSEGIGKSERVLLSNANFGGKLKIIFNQIIKTLGTWLIGTIYIAEGKSEQGKMLFKYRNWFLKGFLRS